jgi:hypothetical protein
LSFQILVHRQCDFIPVAFQEKPRKTENKANQADAKPIPESRQAITQLYTQDVGGGEADAEVAKECTVLGILLQTQALDYGLQRYLESVQNIGEAICV